MRKTISLLAILLVLAAAGYSQQFSLKFDAGLGSISTGDIADGIQGMSDLLKVYYGSVGQYDVPRMGGNFYAELVYHFGSSLGIGLGSGYFFCSKQSTIAYSLDTLDVNQTIDPRVGVIPVTATLHFFPALSSKLKLDLGAGAGLYIAHLNYEELIDVSNVATGTLRYIYSSGGRLGYGFHAGLSLEYALSPTLALVAGVQGRFASVKLSSGTWKESGSGAFGDYSDSGTDHTAWYFEWTPVEGDKAYPQLSFVNEAPTGADVANVRQAKLGLTGYVFSVGVRIAFGSQD